jgi:hypothetical protein
MSASRSVHLLFFPAPKAAMDAAEPPTLVEAALYQLTTQITTPTVSTATPKSVNRYRVILLVPCVW